MHSNSVIEDLGTWKKQVAFANEIRRVGKGVWVQTPAKSSPRECHTLDPVWGVLNRPSLEQIDEFLVSTRLLTLAEMQELFPDCEILVERLAGLAKSYIAFRPAGKARELTVA